jgi:putative ABC transport system permease protein
MSVVMSIDTTSTISALSGSGGSGKFVESLNKKEYILENYDVLGGESAYYPTNKNEVALVVSNSNAEAIQTLQSYGYMIPADKQTIDFEELLGKEFKVLSTERYFQYDGENDQFNKLDLRLLDENNQPIYSQIPALRQYYAFEDNETLKVTCVLRAKEGAVSQVLSSGIMYLPELSEHLRNEAKESTIYQKTLELDIDDQLYIPFAPSIAEMSSLPIDMGAMFTYYTPREIMDKINSVPYNLNLTKDDAIQLALQMIGASSIPSSISVYTKSFDAKTNLINYIGEWNSQPHAANNKITYSDATEFLTKTLGNLVDIVSYVLIAFAGISLVVSSIMIGIITYTSVIERTKEIGVLRSIGARKKDITRVFNSETLIIGFVAGTIGVLVSWGLTFPISAIIKLVAGGSINTSLAILTLPNAITLITISTILTMISGLIPSKIAAKKDPVKALRTE